MSNTIEVDSSGYGYGHPVGDEGCSLCWDTFPQPCQVEACVGLVHATFGDESWDSYWLYYKCDVCGSTEAPE